VRPFDVVTFDCYGTLIDWETGITKAFQDAAAADGVTLDPAAVLQALFDTRPESDAPAYRTYREVLTEAALRVGGRLGWSIDRARAAFLPDSLPRWMPFADTNAALGRLSQAGYALGILSNVDDDCSLPLPQLPRSRSSVWKTSQGVMGPRCTQPASRRIAGNEIAMSGVSGVTFPAPSPRARPRSALCTRDT
jgi:HAD superfamily hydrolase (TIGR01493 family)